MRKAALASEKWRENEGRGEGEGNRPKTGKETQVASQNGLQVHQNQGSLIKSR